MGKTISIRLDHPIELIQNAHKYMVNPPPTRR